MVKHRFVALLSMGALLVVARRAEATPTSRLVYVRSDGGDVCPDEETLRQSVMGHLGYDPFRPFAETTVFAEVHRQGERFVGSVKMLDARGIERGARTLEGHGAACDELIAALALSISIAIDPRAALRSPTSGPAAPIEAPATDAGAPQGGSSDGAPAGAGEPAEASDAERRSPDASSTEVERATPRGPEQNTPLPAIPTASTEIVAPDAHPRSSPKAPLRFAIGGGLYVAVGEGPSPSPGLRISGEIVHRGNLSAAIELRAGLPTSTSITGGTVRTSLFGGAFVPCWRAGWFSACGVAFVGRMASETRDVPSPSSRAFVHVAAGLRAGLDVPLSDALALRFGVDGTVTVAPFVVEVDGRSAYESSPISALVGASLVRSF